MTDSAFAFPLLTDLHNESDVEQKLIFPFATTATPFGLGYPISSILTKKNVRGCEIGKGASKKSYFPDYVLTAGTLPRIVIEAKAPTQQLDEAFREARLYAAEINAQFQSSLNPLCYVLATNGVELWFGYWDQADPIIRASVQSHGVASAEVSSIIDNLKYAKNLQEANQLVAKTKRRLYKPRRMIGGDALQNEEVGLNSFGAKIQGDLLHLFNPSTVEDRAQIVKYAYVGSKRRERFVDPIDRVIRAATPPSHLDSQLIDDTEKPTEIAQRFADLKPLENKILLLIGTVGSGKTTFIDYLQTVALPAPVMDQTIWIRINMNYAPLSAVEIYPWLRREIIDQTKASLRHLDFDDLDQLKKLYSVEVNQFQKGPGKLYERDMTIYSIKLAELLQKLQTDDVVTANACARYCAAERGKLLVITLDNCDKRTLDEQLLMFQAAQWVQKQFRCIIVLPLREETYDNYRDTPPLDTALKDLVFRIEAPMFQNVLHKRIQLALNKISAGAPSKLYYDLPNGFRVECGADEISYYLTSIVRSIFEHDRFIRRLITGLAGRNIRRALEIFIEFCTSGHIGEDQILKIKHAKGAYSLPLDVVSRVLLRTKRRLYDSDHSYVKNVYGANWQDEDPNHFVRKIILTWLFKKLSEPGPSGLKGYFSVQNVKEDMAPFGITEKAIDREITYLAKAQCIVSENYKVEGLQDSDLIRLAPAGHVHLDLLTNVDYLAAVAEDTYFDNADVAQQIADSLKKGADKLDEEDTLKNSSFLIDFLASERTRRASLINIVSSSGAFEEFTALTVSTSTIQNARKLLHGPQWIDAAARYPVGSTHTGIIVNPHPEHGLFVELEPGITGLVPKSTLNLSEVSRAEYLHLNEESVKVQILKIDPVKARLALKLIEFTHD